MQDIQPYAQAPASFIFMHLWQCMEPKKRDGKEVLWHFTLTTFMHMWCVSFPITVLHLEYI